MSLASPPRFAAGRVKPRPGGSLECLPERGVCPAISGLQRMSRPDRGDDTFARIEGSDLYYEVDALAPEPIPDLNQARNVLEDFTIF